MTDKLPLILSVKKIERADMSSDGWPVVECEVETKVGKMVLPLTSNAAHDLKDHLEFKDLPPRATPGATR